MAPSIVSVRIRSERGFKLRLWLPVFILWPFALILFLIIAPFLAIAEAVLVYRGTRIHLFGMLAALFLFLCSLYGTSVKVNNAGKGNEVMVKIY